MIADANRHITKVGGKTDLDALGAEGKTDGIGGIVRDSKGRDFDVANAKAAASVEMLRLREFGWFAGVISASAIPGMVRTFGQVDGNIQLLCQALESGNMVGVLVRDQDGGNFFGALAKTFQTLKSFAAGEAGIDQNAR